MPVLQLEINATLEPTEVARCGHHHWGIIEYRESEKIRHAYCILVLIW